MKASYFCKLLIILLTFAAEYSRGQTQVIDSLENKLNIVREPVEKLKLYLALVEAYNEHSPSEKGIQRAIEGIELALMLKDDFSRSRLLRQRGELHNELYQNEYDKALSYFFEALEIGRRLKKEKPNDVPRRKEMASALNSIAYMYWQWGKLHQSRLYYDSAITSSMEIWEMDSTYGPNIRLLGLEHNSKGAVLWGMGEYKEAIANYFRAISFFEQMGMKKHLSLTNTNIGLIYESWEQKQEALFYFRRAVALGVESADPTAIGYALSSMGRFKEADGDYDSALYYYQRSTDSYMQVENMWGVGLNLIGTGRMYAQMKDYKKSLEAFENALNRAEKNKTFYWIAMAKYNMAATLASMGQYRRALQLAGESNVLAKENGYQEIVKDNYLNIARIYELQGDYKNAYANFQLHSALRDSLFSQDQFKQIALMKEQFEVEKKEKENELLRKERQFQEDSLARARIERFGLILLLAITFAFAVFFIISRAKIKKINRELSLKNAEVTRQKEELSMQAEELRRSNDIKNLMFSIVSHDLRGPIINVGNLVQMLNNEELSISHLKKLLPSVAANIANVTDLTDNLLYWARSQMEGIKTEPRTFDLHEHMLTRLPFFEKAADEKGVKVINKLKSGTEVYADAYMVELVLRNLLNNAIKFCITGDTISLSAHSEAAQTIVTVKDTGQGIADEHLPRIFTDVQFSTPGTRREKGAGLGLMLCKRFVEINNGTIWVDTVYGKGSSFHFTLPNSEAKKSSITVADQSPSSKTG